MAGLIGLSSAIAQARSLPPQDECGVDASFRVFRTKLLKAIARKDKRYLLSIISPDIQNGTDGDAQRGQAVFVERWALHQPARSPVWAELKTILALGCSRRDGWVIAPYMFGRFPDDLATVQSLVIVKPDTVLRAAPERTAPVKARLSWRILTKINQSEQPLNEQMKWRHNWIHVRTSDGQSGYIDRQAIHSSLDYGAVFEKINDRWVMIYFFNLDMMAASPSVATQARSLPSKDECRADPSFRAFRAKLLDAIARKDKRHLLSILSPDIQNSFDGDDGEAGFIDRWKLDQPARSRVWAELKTIFALGCALDDEWAKVPYLSGRFPEDLDSLNSVVIVKPGTLLHAAPHRTAPVKAKPSTWDILREMDIEAEWVQVLTPGGQLGYVEERTVRRPADYRATFNKIDGRWVMTVFLAGD